MAFDLPSLRIVCMRCPAHATLLLVEFEAYEDSVLVWCECHGEHMLAVLSGELLRRNELRDAVAGIVTVPMQALRMLSREQAAERRKESMRLMSMAAKRVEAFDHFLASPAGPDVEPREWKRSYQGQWADDSTNPSTVTAPTSSKVER